jgi:hypothetical protein
MRARRNGHARTRLEGHGLLTLCLPPPHLPLPAQDVPDLIDGMVRHGLGDPSGRQLEMSHPATVELEQNPDTRAIRRDNIRGLRQLPGIEIPIHIPSVSVPQTITHAYAWVSAISDKPGKAGPAALRTMTAGSHLKVLGAQGDGTAVLESADIIAASAGMVT